MGRISKTARKRVVKKLEYLKYYPASCNHKEVAKEVENIILKSFCRINQLEDLTKTSKSTT